MKPIPRIVCIGGGTGTFAVLSALKKYPVHLTAIVSMADDGGTMQVHRDQYGVLPPTDVRKAMIALAEDGSIMREVFSHRFKGGPLDDFTIGNLFLTALEQITGSFGTAVEHASKILNIHGDVVPVTLDNVRLHAELEDGTMIHTERELWQNASHTRSPIKRVWLDPKGRINPKARAAIMAADLIIIGPGDIYSSLVPDFLVVGMPKAIRDSKAKKLFICNLMTRPGETDHFTAKDFVAAIERYIGIDLVLFNTKTPSEHILKKYKKEKSDFVVPPKPGPGRIFADVLADDGYIRHDSGKKLAKVLMKLLNK